MPSRSDALILGGARTPIGRYGGALSSIRTDDLLGIALRAACERVGVPLDAVQEIAAGCVNVAHEGMGDIARWAALAAGFPDHVPAYTINRFCASSLTTTINIANSIRAGEFPLGMAAGVESMSRSGWALMKGEQAFSPRGPLFLLDTMWAGAGGPVNPKLLAREAHMSMIETAQKVATKVGITREEIDAFALRSQKRAAAARDSGRFAKVGSRFHRLLRPHRFEKPVTSSQVMNLRFEFGSILAPSTGGSVVPSGPSSPSSQVSGGGRNRTHQRPFDRSPVLKTGRDTSPQSPPLEC